MKSLLLIFVLALSASALAQHRHDDRPAPRGPRYNPGPRDNRYIDPRRTDIRRVDPRRVDPRHRDRVIIVGPRYYPNPHTHRIVRSSRRAPLDWSRSRFGYSCRNNVLELSGRYIHTFRYQSECLTALADIRHYGDFCDGEDLYDQSGRFEAQFSYDYQCRNALGWYY